MSLNGVVVGIDQYLQPGGGGPGTTCWVIPGSILKPGPVTMKVSARELGPVLGVELKTGINVVQY